MRDLARRFYEFGPFRVDAFERRLLRDGQLVPLPSRIFDILLVLVENAGQTVEKDRLMESIWADTFVEEGNLTRNISTLRKALGDGSRDQRFVKTIPKHGYRFTSEVRQLPSDRDTILVEKTTSVKLDVFEHVEDTGVWSLPRSLIWPLAAVVMIAGIAASGFWLRAPNDESRAGPAVSETAQGLYERGRALWRTRNGEDLHNATTLLERAVAADPQFALAHAGLADAYAFDYRNWPLAEAEANTAIALDPTLGEPHATLGFIRMFWQWRLKDAEAEFKTAVSLSPEYATGHQWYAANLFALGRSGHAALAELKRAEELEPDSIAIAADLCQALYFLHRYDEAAARCQNVIGRDAGHHNAYLHLYEIYNALGRHDDAVEAYFMSQATHGLPQPPGALDQLRQTYRKDGIRAFWRSRFETAPDRYIAAQHLARLGLEDEAFRELYSAYEKRDFEFVTLLADPVFEPLSSDPRFAELERLLLESD